MRLDDLQRQVDSLTTYSRTLHDENERLTAVIAGTDSTSFNNAGLPGVSFAQDPIEYNTLTHHTNLDTYERIIPDDVRKAAAIVAAAVWHVANRDEMVPRFTKETMPAPVEAR